MDSSVQMFALYHNILLRILIIQKVLMLQLTYILVTHIVIERKYKRYFRVKIYLCLSSFFELYCFGICDKNKE